MTDTPETISTSCRLVTPRHGGPSLSHWLWLTVTGPAVLVRVFSLYSSLSFSPTPTVAGRDERVAVVVHATMLGIIVAITYLTNPFAVSDTPGDDRIAIGRLVSLKDMLQIRAPAFIELGRIAGRIAGILQFERGPMSQKQWRWFLDQVSRLHAICEQLALPTANGLISRTVERLSRKRAPLGWSDAKSEFAHLMEVIEVELAGHYFLFIAPERARYWKPDIAPIIQAQFGSASAELVQASVCIAVESDTAAVFHLMRALEKGLAALAMTLSVPHELENWQNIIEGIEKNIAGMKALPRGAKKSADQQFYSEAAKEFTYFKDAWRNHVAHSRATYDFGQAVKVYSHVQDFIAHIATRLHE